MFQILVMTKTAKVPDLMEQFEREKINTVISEGNKIHEGNKTQ